MRKYEIAESRADTTRVAVVDIRNVSSIQQGAVAPENSSHRQSWTFGCRSRTKNLMVSATSCQRCERSPRCRCCRACLQMATSLRRLAASRLKDIVQFIQLVEHLGVAVTMTPHFCCSRSEKSNGQIFLLDCLGCQLIDPAEREKR